MWIISFSAATFVSASANKFTNTSSIYDGHPARFGFFNRLKITRMPTTALFVLTGMESSDCTWVCIIIFFSSLLPMEGFTFGI
jgi:hypothetical protein